MEGILNKWENRGGSIIKRLSAGCELDIPCAVIMGIQLCESDYLCTHNEDTKNAGILKCQKSIIFLLPSCNWNRNSNTLSEKGRDKSSKEKKLHPISISKM